MPTRYVLTILVLLTVAVPPSPAHAGGVVTVCDEAHLLTALVGGGTVTFACSGTITLTAEIVIAADTTIDGSGRAVTISGNDAVRVFIVNEGVTLDLNELTVANGSAGYGGGIYNRGMLSVINSTFSDNSATFSGGGIWNLDGTVDVSTSIFSSNSAVDGGGGVMNYGNLTVTNSAFSGNSAFHGGGAIYSTYGGPVTITNSTFSDNSTSDGGGAIYSDHDSMLTVSNSTFSGNGANHGGGIDVHHSAVIVSNSAVFGNRANGDFGRGGGIYRDYSGTMTVINSTFSDNSASFSGGGIYSVDGAVDVSSSTFSDNSSSLGGGIYVGYGALTVSNSTFSGNSASYDGGGIFNGIYGMLTVSTSTFSRNHADNRGGGITTKCCGSTVVINSTLFGNSSGVRGGGIDNSAGCVTIQNTILANSPAGNGCYGTITDGGGNLSYPDASCPGINADPKLGPLQNNGGPTHTMEPGPGSAAIDAGIDAICAAPPVNNLDQRGITRPAGAHCDIGAVERLPFRKWLPTILSQ